MIAVDMPAIDCVEGHQADDLVRVRLLSIVWVFALERFKLNPDGSGINLFPTGHVIVEDILHV